MYIPSLQNPELLNLHKRLSIQSLILENSTHMYSICQYFNTIDVEVCFTMCGDFTWRVSDCEELEGFLTGGGGVGFTRIGY